MNEENVPNKKVNKKKGHDKVHKDEEDEVSRINVDIPTKAQIATPDKRAVLTLAMDQLLLLFMLPVFLWLLHGHPVQPRSEGRGLTPICTELVRTCHLTGQARPNQAQAERRSRDRAGRNSIHKKIEFMPPARRRILLHAEWESRTNRF